MLPAGDEKFTLISRQWEPLQVMEEEMVSAWSSGSETPAPVKDRSWRVGGVRSAHLPDGVKETRSL